MKCTSQLYWRFVSIRTVVGGKVTGQTTLVSGACQSVSVLCVSIHNSSAHTGALCSEQKNIIAVSCRY